MRKHGCLLMVFLSLLPCCKAWGITGLGVGVRGGMIRNYPDDNLKLIPTRDEDWLKEMPMLGAHIKIATFRVIDLEASVEYAWKSERIVLDNLIEADFSIKDLSLNGTAKYVFSSPILKPYLGVGRRNSFF